MSLESKAIDRLFARLSATYGVAFLRQYEGVEPGAVKALWGHELAVFEANLGRIAWALEHLPERCPNVIEFKNLCRQAPVQEVKALLPPKADPARLAAEVEKLQAAIAEKPASGYDFKAWAKNILANPQGRTPTVLEMARRAVGVAA
jgi:hypothetical protein